MKRREVLGLAAVTAGVLGGCSNGAEPEQPAGEIDVTFETRAAEPYTVTLSLVDADGETVEEFSEELAPDETDPPTFSATDLSNGPYTVTVETDADSTDFEWSVESCRRMDLAVTVTRDGLVEYNSRCSD